MTRYLKSHGKGGKTTLKSEGEKRTRNTQKNFYCNVAQLIKI